MSRLSKKCPTCGTKWKRGAVMGTKGVFVENVSNKFKIGDIVQWTDPDKGKCSRRGVICNMRTYESLEIFSVMVDTDDRKRMKIECFAHELNHLIYLNYNE